MATENHKQLKLLELIDLVKGEFDRCHGLDLLKPLRTRILASIATMEDTTFAMMAFNGIEYFAFGPNPDQYLRLYGVLQAIHMQQDALKSLGHCIGEKFDISLSPQSARYREVRRLVSHATNTKIGAHATYCFVQRRTITSTDFNYEVYSSNGIASTERIYLGEAIAEQTAFSISMLERCGERLGNLLEGSR